MQRAFVVNGAAIQFGFRWRLGLSCLVSCGGGKSRNRVINDVEFRAWVPDPDLVCEDKIRPQCSESFSN